jgi:hypothetical protein
MGQIRETHSMFVREPERKRPHRETYMQMEGNVKTRVRWSMRMFVRYNAVGRVMKKMAKLWLCHSEDFSSS